MYALFETHRVEIKSELAEKSGITSQGVVRSCTPPAESPEKNVPIFIRILSGVGIYHRIFNS